MKNKAVSLRPR